ncbi:MAG: hypothetical protein ACRDMH_18485 [Solirubrobacterales bacterium]
MGLIAILVATWLLVVTWPHAVNITGFWVIDDRAIGVEVLGGPQSSCWVTSMVERATEVQIKTDCRDWPSLSATNAGGYFFDLTAPLAAPLADRHVLNGDGVRVEERKVPRPTYDP